MLRLSVEVLYFWDIFLRQHPRAKCLERILLFVTKLLFNDVDFYNWGDTRQKIVKGRKAVHTIQEFDSLVVANHLGRFVEEKDDDDNKFIGRTFVHKWADLGFK